MGNHSQTSPSHKNLLIVALLIFSIGLLLAIFSVVDNTFMTAKKKSLPTASQYTKGEMTKSSGTISQTNTPQPGDQKSNTNSVSSADLHAPTGDFVSNHTPGQDGSPLSETSTCNTSPGATCQITFTQNGVTKTLPPETTDRGGAAYWNTWVPSAYGLSSGLWQIKAIATLNGQTKTALDAMNLEIQ